MAYTYTKNSEDAMDVVQEAAYRAFLKFDTVQEIKYVKTWLIKITVNCAIDLLRKQQKIFPIKNEDLNIYFLENYDISLSLSLEELLDLLNTNERAIIFLKYYHEYTFQQISEIINLPSSTVKSTHYRALNKLRNQIRREDMYGE
ncbi:RNA polymerase [Bacillus cereus]|uniref:RNA polymerase n=2 Tax=Bacillus cereus TaxID=1396 RepID=A0AA44TCG9_BACCE|nr:RNA polymerase [Bacillus cereus]PFR89854.1 RNA polymerase [Bacillus cereus]